MIFLNHQRTNTMKMEYYISIFIFLTIILCHADEKQLLNSYFTERNFIERQGVKESINHKDADLSNRLQEFKTVASKIAVPQKLTDFSKVNGKLLFNLKERYGNRPYPLGTALDYTTGPNGMILAFNGDTYQGNN